jgi:hypothetical protein
MLKTLLTGDLDHTKGPLALQAKVAPQFDAVIVAQAAVGAPRWRFSS